MKLSSWRVALRIARRDALRAKGRSALVVAMVALPVLGVTGADVVFRSAELGPAERAVRTMGQADGELRMVERGVTLKQAPDPDGGLAFTPPATKDGKPDRTPEQQLSLDTDPTELARRLLPAGTTLIPEGRGPYTATTSAEGLISVETVEADLTDPVWRGKVNLVEGRAPGAGHEVAVTRAFLDRSRLKLGGTTSVRGLEATPFTITGVVEYPGELTSTTLVARPGDLIEPLAKLPGGHAGGTPRELDQWLVKLPAGAVLDWAKVTELNKYGFTAASHRVMVDPPPRADVPLYAEQDAEGSSTGLLDRTGVVILATVAGMALLEIVLLAGPAFAVGARRSRRQLGLLAAGGGDRAQVRAVVLGGGVVLGTTGAVVGLGLGVGLVALLRTQAEEYAGSRFGHFALQPLDLLGVLLIGLVTGLLAAIVPAVQAARQDVVAALTGRDSLKPPSRWLALIGLLMLGGGAALALLGATSGFASRSVAVLGGSVIAELGMVALVPYLVGLFGRIGRWLPLGPRLALRDSVRHRGRTAPAVAAVMAAVAGSVAVSIYVTSTDEGYRRGYEASAPAGAVMLATGWGPAADGSLLPQMRNAVESNMPGLGPRADVQKLRYPANCVDGNGSCGYVTPALPKELRCPLEDDRTELSGAEITRMRNEDQRCQFNGHRGLSIYGSVGAGDAALLRNLHGITDPAAAKALADGKAVVLDPRYIKDGKLILETNDPPPAGGPIAGPGDDYRKRRHEITVDAVLVTTSIKTAQAVLSPDTARRLGLGVAEAGSVWLPDGMPGDAAEQKAAGALGKLADHTQFSVERGYQTKGDLITLGLSGFAALVALGAAGIATGLAAADSQRDLTTLAAVGATPRIRRSLSGFQCGVIAAMGTLLGAVCGVVPAVALRKVLGAVKPYPGISAEELANRSLVVFPWIHVALIVIALPVIAAGLAALVTRSRISLLRRSG
ncbi:FtsX-like permease family protein [Kitasatospora aureofaciens]|uniref:FtsX-like permease family protein n=1 Tax=Kitasatospora aureofaciens TaxID=1894 RepID=UPI001C488D79|nr:FtsX-like permease family protein [Kitasatospora aureofaciens]MBV6700000.1 FtsX-like permease family protein [Kitasatospora aureofaciens]